MISEEYRTKALKQMIVESKVVNKVYLPTKYFAGCLIEHESDIQFLHVPNGQHDKLEIGVSKDFVLFQMKGSGEVYAFIIEFEPRIENDLLVGKFAIKDKYVLVGVQTCSPVLEFKQPRRLLKDFKKENKIRRMSIPAYIKDMSDPRWGRVGGVVTFVINI